MKSEVSAKPDQLFTVLPSYYVKTLADLIGRCHVYNLIYTCIYMYIINNIDGINNIHHASQPLYGGGSGLHVYYVYVHMVL